MKIAIVGSGGAGMTAAWLLDGRHEVTLFERSAELGGHAHTVTVDLDGQRCVVDDGFGWFSEEMYPSYMRLLEQVGVATRVVRITMSFTQRSLARTLLLPPAKVSDWWRALTSARHVTDLLRLDRAIGAAVPVVRDQDRRLTWAEFLGRHRFDGDFCRHVLTPLIVGSWGCPHDRVDEVSAYSLMKYVVFHRPSGLSARPWRVVRDGASSYIRAVAATLRTATLLTETAVARLEPTALGWRLHDGRGLARDFDHVLVATGAPDAQSLLRGPAELAGAREVLSGFEYYTVRLATHSDPAFMPPNRADWQVANIIADGPAARLSTWGQKHSGVPVFASYVGEEEPRRCHGMSTFHLPLMTPSHYRAQEALARIQGQHRLSFAGDWTRDIGCHEDAVVSAMDACRALDPALPRLDALRPPAGPWAPRGAPPSA